jgi:hypothetical protein
MTAHELGGNIGEFDREAPPLVRGKKEPERFTVLIRYNGGGLSPERFRRKGEDEVEREKKRQRRQDERGRGQ